MLNVLKNSTRLMMALLVAVLSTGMIACSSGDTDDPMGPQVNPKAQPLAGTYTSHYRWGGASGLWRGETKLSIQPDGSVTYGSTQIINPQFGENTLAWSMADGNPHSAGVTFQPSDNRDYYWRDKAADRMNFTGWRQNPGEGKLDFRGLKD